MTFELSKILLHANDISPGVIQGLRINQLLDEIATHYDFRELEEMEWIDINIKSGKIASVENLKNLLSELNRDSLVMRAYPYMRTEDGTLLGIINWINFQLKENDDLTNHEKLFASLGIIITDSCKLVSNAYYGKVLYGDPINVVNKLHESNLFEYIELDYVMEVELFQLPNPNDPYYFSDQWAIPKMQVNNAWNLSRGENIKIAVLDNGVDLTHDDLKGNLHYNGYDATGSRNDASPNANDYHGTLVSGIATMVANNGIGGAGIAYNAKLIPIRVFKDGKIKASDVSKGISEADKQGADIINMSFGVGSSSSLTSTINHVATNGRNGKGCILFAASGNDTLSSVAYPARLANVIAVGSSTKYDTKRTNSRYGPDLGLVAPGEYIFSTDISGRDGNCPGPFGTTIGCRGWDYWADFHGTSASSSAAAAVMALILSINPDLTREQATKIIKLTCDRVGGYLYNKPGPYGPKSHEMGYGRVNARRAVIEAFQSKQPITGPDILCTTNTNYTLVGAPQNASITWSFNPSNRVVTWSGSGTTATLRGSCSTNGYGRLTFNIEQPGMGTWQVYKDKIIVNGPDITDVEFDVYYTSGQKAPGSGSNWALCPNTHYHIYFRNNSICWTSNNNYSWTIPSGWNLNYQYQNMISIYTNTSPGGDVQVRGQTCCTGCGSNVTLLSGYFSQYWNCDYGYMTVYPNPAGNYFDIDIEQEKAGIDGLSRKIEYMLTITDNMGMVKHTDRIYEFPHRVNTMNLPNGVYIIRVIYEGKAYSSRLVIEN